ncbi:MAG: hypothetical protein LBM93_14375 [Oscillospiraceae bacterium]|jgi:hypothetical protein|nr:hypothetical protein [Oscillospiraceae bacterium]
MNNARVNEPKNKGQIAQQMSTRESMPERITSYINSVVYFYKQIKIDEEKQKNKTKIYDEKEQKEQNKHEFDLIYSHSVKELNRIFYGDRVKTFYYMQYMQRLLDSVLAGENFDMVVLVAKKGVICFRSFLKLYKQLHKSVEFKKYASANFDAEKHDTFIIDSRTMCSYDFKSFAETRIKKDENETKTNENETNETKTKEIKDLKLLVFDDTVNLGRNLLSIISSLVRRGVKNENITVACPTINELIFDREAYVKDHQTYIDTTELKIYDKDKLNKKESKAFVAKIFDPRKETAKVTNKNLGKDFKEMQDYIFENYFDKKLSYGFVGSDEIVSRAYQINQFAHCENVPYTSYCSYIKSKDKAVNDSINAAFADEEFQKLFKKVDKNKDFIYSGDRENALYAEVPDVRMKVCSSVNVRSRIIFTNFDVRTAAYYGFRIFENDNEIDNEGKEYNKQIRFSVLYPFVTMPNLSSENLKGEYESFFDGEVNELLFGDKYVDVKGEEKSLLNQIPVSGDNSELWEYGFDFLQTEIDGIKIDKSEIDKATNELKKLYDIKDYEGYNLESLKQVLLKANGKDYDEKNIAKSDWDLFEKGKLTEELITQFVEIDGSDIYKTKLTGTAKVLEVLYYRRKVLHECAMRRLLNIKTALVSFDLLKKLKNFGAIRGNIDKVTNSELKLNELRENEAQRLINEIRGKGKEDPLDYSYGNLMFSLAKCVVKQMFQDAYSNVKQTVKDENGNVVNRFKNSEYAANVKMLKVIRALNLLYGTEEKQKNTEQTKKIQTTIDQTKEKPEDLEDLYGRCFFKAHEGDDGSAYYSLDVVKDAFLRKEYSHLETYEKKVQDEDKYQYQVVNIYEKGYKNVKDETQEYIKNYNYYLEFYQAVGTMFYRLKNQDKTMHKIPPFATHLLLNIVIFKIFAELDLKDEKIRKEGYKRKKYAELNEKFDSEKLKRNRLENFHEDFYENQALREIILAYMAAMISVCEDGFAGTVVYSEPELGNPANKFYSFNCAQHGEDPVQVLELYLGDYLCVNSLLESTAHNTRHYLGRVDDEIYDSVRDKVCNLVDDFTVKTQKADVVEKKNHYKNIRKDAQKFKLLVHLAKDFIKGEEYEIIRKRGEGIFRSSIYIEQSPAFIRQYGAKKVDQGEVSGEKDELIARLFDDIYKIKREMLDQVYDKAS